MDLIKKIESENLREENFDFNVGDTVRISYRIKELLSTLAKAA